MVTLRPEVNFGILCANVPLVRAIYLRYTERLRISNLKASSGRRDQRIWPSKSGASVKGFDPAAAVKEKALPTRPFDSDNTTSTDETLLPMQPFSNHAELATGWPEEPDRVHPGFGSERTLRSGRADERWVEEQV